MVRFANDDEGEGGETAKGEGQSRPHALRKTNRSAIDRPTDDASRNGTMQLERNGGFSSSKMGRAREEGGRRETIRATSAPEREGEAREGIRK